MNKSLPLSLTVCLMLACTLGAQPTVIPPNFDVGQVAVGVPINGNLSSSALDVFGNLYIVDEPPGPTSVGPRVHRVRRDGTIDLDHAVGFGNTGQLAHNPADGLVYLVDSFPLLPVIDSRVWRIEPTGGKTLIRHVPVVAEGFTIDNDGRMFFGGMGLQGPGLYRTTPLSNGLIFLGPGFGSNAMLQSLVSGDVLIASGNAVRRWTPNALLPVPYWQGPPILPNSGSAVVGLGRTPFNQIGSGGVIAVNSFTTVCFCGDGDAITADLVGGNAAPFANEPYSMLGRGLRSVAWGLRQDMAWITVQQGIVPGFFAIVHRIRQLPVAPDAGVLKATVQPGLLTLDLYGHPSGGAPFIIGARPLPALTTGDGLFIPPYGILQLNPLLPDYVAILDGIGLFGPPNPLAQIPAGGHFTLTISIPTFGIPLALRSEAGIVDVAHAPNGLFYISNLETFILP